MLDCAERSNKPAKRWLRKTAAARRDLPRQLVHGRGELDVKLGQAAGIMGRQRHLDGLVDIEPFRMMVELFGDERGARHEAESLIEIGKDEFLGDGVAPSDLAPALETGQRGLA